MNTETRPNHRTNNLIENINNRIDNAIVQQHKKLQAVIIEDPLKWTASKLNYPIRRVNLDDPFTENFKEIPKQTDKNTDRLTLTDLKPELDLLNKTEKFHYQPIILTIRSTRQRYFLPETSYV